MIFRVGIENSNDGRSIAWALEYPACFAYGPDSRAVEENFRPARDYARWIACHGSSWLEGVNSVIGLEGEIWGPRKMLRRAPWHERDHTEHIRKAVTIACLAGPWLTI